MLRDIEELRRLEALESAADQRRAARVAALADAAAVRQRIRIERSGARLPDAAGIITRLREERTDELAGLR